MVRILHCENCQRPVPFYQLDAKPKMTLWLRGVRLVRGQRFMLGYAADRGYDFDRLECRDCYGPGYITREA